MLESNLLENNLNEIKIEFNELVDKIQKLNTKIQLNIDPSNPESKKVLETEQIILNLLNQLNEKKTELNELIEIYEQKNEKLIGINRKNDFLNKENEPICKEIVEAEKAFEEKTKNLMKFEKLNKSLIELREQNLKQLTHKNKMQVLLNNNEIFEKIFSNQLNHLNILNGSKDEDNLLESILLEKYTIFELLTGIKIKNVSNENRENIEKSTDQIKCNILIRDLPDDCLDLEKNRDLYPSNVKQSFNQLSCSLVESFKLNTRKNKNKNANNNKKKSEYLVVNNLIDFQIIYDNYVYLLCAILTKQEIKEATKQFAVDWVEGSQVVTILINSKSSKMATIVLPKFYPLTGTSHIRLISLTGYDDSAIKNFYIDNNMGSLSEWFSHFTDMYNTNTILLAIK